MRMWQEKTSFDVNETLIDSYLPANELTSNDEIKFLSSNSKWNKRKLGIELDTDSNTKDNSTGKGADDEEHKIRIGSEFQAVCPPLIPIEERNLASIGEKALTVWIPKDDFPDSMLQSYISLANKKFSYNIEQALGMLYWHKFDVQAAIRDLENFAPFPDEWTREEKIIFEDALLFHGKNFHRIRELLPDKTLGGVIEYYYMWKKRTGRQRSYDGRRRRPRTLQRGQPVENITTTNVP